MRRATIAAAIATTAVILAGCTAWQDPIPPRQASGSLGQVWVTGLQPGQVVHLLASASGTPVAQGTADANGSYVFYGLEAGKRWIQADGHPLYDTPQPVLPVRHPLEQPTAADFDRWVADDHHDASRPLLSTQLPAGEMSSASGAPTFSYLPARDSTALAALVAVPPGTCTTAGQANCVRRPTVVMPTPYGSASALYRPGDRFHPPAVADEAQLGGLELMGRAKEFTDHGYAFVAYDVRGTGCSGGAYDSAGSLIASDAYDAVEIAARQPWSTGSVALFGFSGPGIAAVMGATAHPPHLDALMVGGFGDVFEAVRPGGLEAFGVTDRSGDGTALTQIQADGTVPPNTGSTQYLGSTSWEIFQVVATNSGAWPTDPAVVARNLPIPGSERLAYAEACAQNQALHLQRSLARTASGQRPSVDRTILDAARTVVRNPGGANLPFPQFAPHDAGSSVEVPTFVTGTWRDSVVGDAADAALDFPNAPTTWAFLTNGYHDQTWLTVPGATHRWRFLRLHLARMPASWDGTTQATLHGATPPSGWAAEAAAADAAPVQIAWSWPNGADLAAPAGTPVITSHAALPDGTDASGDFGTGRIWFHDDATMTDVAPTAATDPAGSVAYHELPGERRRVGQWYGSSEPWPDQVDGGTVRFDSVPAPSPAGLWLAGPSSVDLWVRSSGTDAALQVALSEVRADGTEILLQGGWRRASMRALDDSSTPLVPRFTDDALQPLTPNTWTQVRVALPSIAAHLHPGSRLRIDISAPGGDHVNRVFDGEPSDRIDIGTGPAHPSSLYLSFLSRTPANSVGATDLTQLGTSLDAFRSANGLGCDPDAGRYEDSRAQPCRRDRPLGS